MNRLFEYKSTCLEHIHQAIPPIVDKIRSAGDTHQNQAKSVNREISAHLNVLTSDIPSDSSTKDRQQMLIILRYCISVASIEYRHAVWQYEYMALSRRVGELWERFCSSAWDIPSKSNLKRFEPPSFERVLDSISATLLDGTRDSHRDIVSSIFHDLRDLIGEIHMDEDEVFMVDDIPHVVDFKSGFGSNEKGNMMRLRTVGKAYRLWNPNTRLLFLVRQEQNNNYLEAIRREGLWDVHCGSDAYAKIDEITGSDMSTIREYIVDFETDLSEGLWNDLKSNLSDLSSYLNW